LLALLALALGVVAVAARVVGELPLVALIAGEDMATEGCASAALDGPHGLEVRARHPGGEGLAVGGARLAEDVRDFEHVRRRALWALRQAVDRPESRLPDLVGGMRVDRPGLRARVSERGLDEAGLDDDALLTPSRAAVGRCWLSEAAVVVAGSSFVVVAARAMWTEALATLVGLGPVGGPAGRWPGPLDAGVSAWHRPSSIGLHASARSEAAT
jgi:hypothetical protein